MYTDRNGEEPLAPLPHKAHLESRLERARQGFFANPFHAARAVAEMDKLPLADYLEEEDRDLEPFVDLGPDATFGMAGELAHQMFTSPYPDERETAEMLLMALARPMAKKFHWRDGK